VALGQRLPSVRAVPHLPHRRIAASSARQQRQDNRLPVAGHHMTLLASDAGTCWSEGVAGTLTSRSDTVKIELHLLERDITSCVKWEQASSKKGGRGDGGFVSGATQLLQACIPHINMQREACIQGGWRTCFVVAMVQDDNSGISCPAVPPSDFHEICLVFPCSEYFVAQHVISGRQMRMPPDALSDASLGRSSDVAVLAWCCAGACFKKSMFTTLCPTIRSDQATFWQPQSSKRCGDNGAGVAPR
jgi:hypothetical protein